MREIVQRHSVPYVDHTIKRGLLSQRSYEKRKRFIDFIGALFGIILLIPLFVLIGLIIKFSEPKCRVLFRQIRVGKNGEKFYIYKFRSMVQNAEEKLEGLIQFNETTGAMFKMKVDPRVTKFGKFIRRTSLDELPQLFNVLKNDMGLVGPRPAIPTEVERYTDYEKQRLLVLPGCTGLWQVSGRSTIGFEEMVRLDLSYISNRNLRLDFKIIFKTILMLFGSKNAF